jgi:hypothetical protein
MKVRPLLITRELIIDAFTQAWEESRRFRFQSWAIPSLLYVPIDKNSLGPL